MRCGGKAGWCNADGQWRRHTPCYGQVAADAAQYPFRMCRAILKGLAREMKNRGRFDEASNLGVTEFDKRIRLIRALSGEMERAIMEFENQSGVWTWIRTTVLS